MKRLALILALLFAVPVFAQTSFNVWTPQGTITLTGSTPEQPNVIFEGNSQILSGNVFKMWYQTGGANPSGPSSGMYYAESSDGINFTGFGSNPVLADAWGIRIFKNGSIYYCYYTTGIATGSTTILVATSTNGTTWTQQSPTSTINATNSAWSTLGIVCQLNVAGKIGATWYGYYCGGTGTLSNPQFTMGQATSTDLINWTPSANNPVPSLLGTSNFAWGGLINGTYYGWTQNQLPGAQNAYNSSNPQLPSDLFRYSAPSVAGPWSRLGNASTITRVLTSEGVNLAVGQVADPSGPVSDGNGNLWMYVTASINGSTGTNYTVDAFKAPNTTLSQLVQTYEGVHNFPINGNPALNFSVLAQDNFQRADANPIGGNWSSVGGFNALQIISNKVEETVSASTGASFYSGQSWNADQWSQVTVGSVLSTSAVAAGVRCTSGASKNGYYFTWIGTAGSPGTWQFQRYVSGTFTEVASGTITINNNDTLTAAIIGTTVMLYWNGTMVYTTTDANLSSGSPAMLVFSSAGTGNASITGWSGGTFQDAPPIGGGNAGGRAVIF